MKQDITIQVSGKSKKIVMTFGLLHEICKVSGDVDGALFLLNDNDLREQALIELLSERNSDGQIEEPLRMFNLDMAQDDVVKLLEWAGKHAADFFVTAMEKAKEIGEEGHARLRKIQSEESGSTGGDNSPSKTPSA